MAAVTQDETLYKFRFELIKTCALGRRASVWQVSEKLRNYIDEISTPKPMENTNIILNFEPSGIIILFSLQPLLGWKSLISNPNPKNENKVHIGLDSRQYHLCH